MDSSGNVYLTGYTNSTDFPTVAAFNATYGGSVLDAFVTMMDTSGSLLVYSSYLGGSGVDIGYVWDPAHCLVSTYIFFMIRALLWILSPMPMWPDIHQVRISRQGFHMTVQIMEATMYL